MNCHSLPWAGWRGGHREHNGACSKMLNFIHSNKDPFPRGYHAPDATPLNLKSTLCDRFHFPLSYVLILVLNPNRELNMDLENTATLDFSVPLSPRQAFFTFASPIQCTLIGALQHLNTFAEFIQLRKHQMSKVLYIYSTTRGISFREPCKSAGRE